MQTEYNKRTTIELYLSPPAGPVKPGAVITDSVDGVGKLESKIV
jgi:hypothetical protein